MFKIIRVSDGNNSALVRFEEGGLVIEDCLTFGIKMGDNIYDFYDRNRGLSYKPLIYSGRHYSKKTILKNFISKNKALTLLIDKFDLDGNNTTGN